MRMVSILTILRVKKNQQIVEWVKKINQQNHEKLNKNQQIYGKIRKIMRNKLTWMSEEEESTKYHDLHLSRDNE
jgi:hypothetical protein